MPRNENTSSPVPVVVINAERSPREDGSGRTLFVVDLTVLAPETDPRRTRVEVGVEGPDAVRLHPGAELTAELAPDGDLAALYVNHLIPTPITSQIPSQTTVPVAPATAAATSTTTWSAS